MRQLHMTKNMQFGRQPYMKGVTTKSDRLHKTEFAFLCIVNNFCSVSNDFFY